MKKIPIIFLLFFTTVTGQADSTNWKHYFRLGAAGVDSSTGAFGYYRLNMQNKTAFRDLRFFSYSLDQNSFVHLRYKSSDKYISRPNFYRYTITSFRKNTRANLNLQYHFNQGFGYFIKDYDNGLINAELGHAFDTSDYLNATRKIINLGPLILLYYLSVSEIDTHFEIFWDHNTNYFSSKLEIEYFEQISEVIENKLSRGQYLLQLIIPMNKNYFVNINFEKEEFFDKNQTDASSISLAIQWNK